MDSGMKTLAPGDDALFTVSDGDEIQLMARVGAVFHVFAGSEKWAEWQVTGDTLAIAGPGVVRVANPSNNQETQGLSYIISRH